MNEYFKLLSKAREKGLESFQYKDQTYVRMTNDKGLIYYKRQIE